MCGEGDRFAGIVHHGVDRAGRLDLGRDIGWITKRTRHIEMRECLAHLCVASDVVKDAGSQSPGPMIQYVDAVVTGAIGGSVCTRVTDTGARPIEKPDLVRDRCEGVSYFLCRNQDVSIIALPDNHGRPEERGAYPDRQ